MPLTGKKFGLVTVVKRAGAQWFAVCECNRGRWFFASNLRAFPPKTHKSCKRGLDVVRAKAYKNT